MSQNISVEFFNNFSFIDRQSTETSEQKFNRLPKKSLSQNNFQCPKIKINNRKYFFFWGSKFLLSNTKLRSKKMSVPKCVCCKKKYIPKKIVP